MYILKKKYEEDLEKTNNQFYNENMEKIKESREKLKNKLKEEYDKMVFNIKLAKIINKVKHCYSLIKFNS